MNEHPAQVVSEGLSDLQEMQQEADVMSLSLLFSLGRRYLDLPFEDAMYLQPLKMRGGRAVPPQFLRLEQVGGSVSGTYSQPLTALQTALTACHDPGRYTLIFVVESDGSENRVYLGVRDHVEPDRAGEFMAYLGGFMRGNWPGTRLVPSEPPRGIPPDALGHAVALTGIPSLKPGDQAGYPQSLDRLLRGLRGHPFLYIVVAEPMPEAEVQQVIYRCRDLLGRVHTLTKTTGSHTRTVGISRTQQQSVTEQKGHSTARSSGRNLGLNLSAVAGALGDIFPPAGFLSLLAIGGGYVFGPSFARTTQESTTESYSRGTTYGETVGQTWSIAQTLGEEYINAHAQAAEQQLQQYIARFEQAGALGCWNVGVYLLAKDRATAQQGGTQLRALLSGGNKGFEPIRGHDLARVWKPAQDDAVSAVREALSHFRQPRIGLVDPVTFHTPLDHPLGPVFNGLTTPINTEELSLLVNLPRREVPGVKLMATADFGLNPPPDQGGDIRLGQILEGGEATSLPYTFSLDALVRHCLVTGATGSGKTTTCHRLMTEVIQRNIPILVIEPAKDEYIQWAIKWNRQSREHGQSHHPTFDVYMPGECELYGQELYELRLNPFQPADFHAGAGQMIDMESRCERFAAVLTASMPMADVLPLLLEEAIFEHMRQQVPGFGRGEVVALNRYPLCGASSPPRRKSSATVAMRNVFARISPPPSRPASKRSHAANAARSSVPIAPRRMRNCSSAPLSST